MENGNNPSIDVRSRSLSVVRPIALPVRALCAVRVSQIHAHVGRDLAAPEMKTQIAERRTGVGVLRRPRIIGQN